MSPSDLFLDENTNEHYCMGCISLGENLDILLLVITGDDRKLSWEISWKILSDAISNF